MPPEVLMDSNVFISFKYEQDENHQRAIEVLGRLEPFPLLTEVAAYEVVEITRTKLNALVRRVYSETSVLEEGTSTRRKVEQLEGLFGRLEEDANLGTFLKVIRDFCKGELERGRSTLDHLVEWASDQVYRTIQDIRSLCRVGDFDGLPGRTTDEDHGFIGECAEALGVDQRTRDRDTQILWDALAHSRFRDEVVLITFDRTFARRAERRLAELAGHGIAEGGRLGVHDINETDPPLW